MEFLKNSLLICLSLLIYGCAQAQPKDMEEKMAYVERYRLLAVEEMERTGIPASIKLGQGLLESRWGTSDLARLANNHFGIKCGKDWNGEGYYKEDDDLNDKGELIKSCFRVYGSAEQCYRDHSAFLMNPAKKERYGPLFELKRTDYRSWAEGLKKGGYATDPGYPTKLIKLIEDFDLHRYDETTYQDLLSEIGTLPTLTQPDSPDKPLPVLVVGVPQSTNDVKYIIAAAGQTVKDIASKQYVSPKALMNHNPHISGMEEPLKAGVRVFLQSKPKGWRGQETYHKVRKGERMIDISVLYAIDLDKLYIRNKMSHGQEPAENALVKIRAGKIKKQPKLQSDQPNKKPTALPTVPNPSLSSAQPAADPATGTVSTKPAKPGPATTYNSDVSATNKPNVPVVSANNSDPFSTAKPSTTTVNTGGSTTSSNNPVAPQYYLVMEGDTLEILAQKFKTSIAGIKKLNNLTSDECKVGSRIRVK
ncbi:MAG TPA: glucosaminidase domain-containing protein [Haliscomenobacter sp.]|uniref:glucosaminidase domain-containing protein n=1 Tax=Haliscomenobacter sp. TaxID=2717303 RepID=UPI002C536E7C|nr:glucosaminidase domain-containing protein [Haliscomenobacter sp.]HOY16555.1 glucosaminidase domain-containing protein [Haliscomenobacter sp.]HPH17908.1 glucosaminidase domain-containing protein [Haliscomenobacter sp.]